MRCRNIDVSLNKWNNKAGSEGRQYKRVLSCPSQLCLLVFATTPGSPYSPPMPSNTPPADPPLPLTLPLFPDGCSICPHHPPLIAFVKTLGITNGCIFAEDGRQIYIYANCEFSKSKVFETESLLVMKKLN